MLDIFGWLSVSMKNVDFLLMCLKIFRNVILNLTPGKWDLIWTEMLMKLNCDKITAFFWSIRKEVKHRLLIFLNLICSWSNGQVRYCNVFYCSAVVDGGTPDPVHLAQAKSELQK